MHVVGLPEGEEGSRLAVFTESLFKKIAELT